MKKLIILIAGLFLTGCATTNISQIRDRWGQPSYILYWPESTLFIYHFPQKNKTALFKVNQTGQIIQKEWAPGWTIEAIKLSEETDKKQRILNEKLIEFDNSLNEKQKTDIQRCLLRKDCELEEYLSDKQVGILSEAKNLKIEIDENTLKIKQRIAEYNKFQEIKKQKAEDNLKFLLLIGAISQIGNAPQFQLQQMPIYQGGKRVNP